MNKSQLVALVAVSFVCSHLYANNELVESTVNNNEAYIYDSAYGGSGCPSGTLDVSLSENKQKISIHTYQYQAQAASSQNTRKNCAVAIALDVPKKVQVALVSATYRGYVEVDRGASASLIAEYFEVGERGAIFTRQWSDPKNAIAEDFVERHVLDDSQQIWSGCGENITLRANTSLKASGKEGGGSSIVVDRRDQSEEIVLQLLWESCS